MRKLTKAIDKAIRLIDVVQSLLLRVFLLLLLLRELVQIWSG